MILEQTFISEEIEARLGAERTRLVRLCAAISGSRDAAEDLAQETLLEAWRNLDKLQDMEGLGQWLAAIARNVCLRWARRNGRELTHRAEDVDSATALAEQPAAFDLDAELQREELAELLERALALLPGDTRRMLVQRYLDEVPAARMAEQLGLSENALAKRLERGKLTLRRLLSDDLDGGAQGWRAMALWCTDCGERHLYYQYDPVAGTLVVRCLHCHAAPGEAYTSSRLPSVLSGFQRVGAAYNRLISWSHEYYSRGVATGTALCPHCGGACSVRVIDATGHDNWRIHVICGTCNPRCNWQGLGGAVLCMPEGRAFWKKYPRLLMLPHRQLEVEGRPALLTTLQSMTTSRKLEAIHDRDTLRLIAIHGALL